MTIATLKQRVEIPYTRELAWIKKALTLKQKQLSPLAAPGELQAYSIHDNVVLLPKTWALENTEKLGITQINDEQFSGQELDYDAVKLTLPHGLRPHQAEAVDKICTALRSSPYGGGALLVLPCGYGKSVSALEVIARMKVKTLIVAHTSVLSKQWAETIKQYVPQAVIGEICQSKFIHEGCTHIIGSLQSLASRAYDFDSAGIEICVVDEAHHISALQMSESINKVGCRYRLGLSATPVRPDGLSPFLGMVFGPIAYEIKRPPSETLRVYSVQLENGPIVSMQTRGAKPTANISGMVNCLQNGSARAEARQQICVDWIKLALTKERKILVVADRIELLKDLESRISSETTTGFMIGSTKQAEREAAKDASVIFGSYSICSEGLDVPDLDTILFLTPRSGVNTITQCIGRLLRLGGRFSLVIDIVDNESTFIGMAKKRNKLYAQMGAQVVKYDEQMNVIN